MHTPTSNRGKFVVTYIVVCMDLVFLIYMDKLCVLSYTIYTTDNKSNMVILLHQSVSPTLKVPHWWDQGLCYDKWLGNSPNLSGQLMGSVVQRGYAPKGCS